MIKIILALIVGLVVGAKFPAPINAALDSLKGLVLKLKAKISKK